MTSTKTMVHKVGSARAMARQRLHELVRASNRVRYSLKRARDLSSQLSWGSRVAWRKTSQITSAGAESMVMVSTVLGGESRTHYLRTMVNEAGGWEVVDWEGVAEAI
jgi:hypothetical protein